MLLATLIHLKPKVHNVATISTFALLSVTCIHSRTVNWLYGRVLILLSGDVEINPGPRHNSGGSFSICHGNLNSVSAYNYTKLSSLKAFMAVHKFDIICLSETYLDSSLAPDDKNLIISANHSSNNKRGGVCVYHKNFLPLWVVHKMGVLGHFALWGIFGLRGIRKFWLKKIKPKILSKFI